MRLLVAVLGALALSATPAHAAQFSVDADVDAHDQSTADGVCKTAANTCTLRAAIEQANALMGPDEIAVPAGTYKLTIAENLAVSSNLTITGTAGARTTVIDINGTTDALVLNGSGVFVSGLAITGATGPPAPLRVDGGEATISGLDIHDNHTTGGNGGGALITGGLVTLTRSAFTHNSTVGSTIAVGGGLDVEGGTVTTIASTF